MTPTPPPRPAASALLAIDTATLQAGVAVVDRQGRPLSSRRARVTTHSEQLLTLVEEALHEAGLGVQDLAALACGAGPGSFTGLRIGLATVKGLCLATGAPLLMVSSLAALALRSPAGTISVPCIDAFKGEVYAGFYLRTNRAEEPLESIEPEAVLAPDRLAAWLAQAANVAAGPSVHLVGDGPARWPVLQVPGVVTIDQDPPDPVDIGWLAALRLGRGERDDVASALPTYIRPSEAEIKGPPPGRS